MKLRIPVKERKKEFLFSTFINSLLGQIFMSKTQITKRKTSVIISACHPHHKKESSSLRKTAHLDCCNALGAVALRPC